MPAIKGMSTQEAIHLLDIPGSGCLGYPLMYLPRFICQHTSDIHLEAESLTQDTQFTLPTVSSPVARSH